MKASRRPVFLRLDERLIEKLKKLAANKNRSLNNMAEVIFEKAVDECESKEQSA